LFNFSAGLVSNASRLKIRVVNMSVVASGNFWSSVCSALAILVTQGVTVVVAAGEAVGRSGETLSLVPLRRS